MRSLWRLGALGGASMLLACGEDAVGPRPVPAAIAVAAGTAQQGTVGQPLDTALTVFVTDKFGDPVPGVLVRFSLPPGGGSIVPVTQTTGPDGHAQAVWTLPTTAGLRKATATAAGLDPVSFSAEVQAALPVSLAIVSGDNQATLVGQALDSGVVVRALDQYGNPVAGATISFVAAAGQGHPIRATVETGPTGEGRTGWVLGDTAGLMHLSVSTGDVAPLTVTATALSVLPPLMTLAVGPEHGCAIDDHDGLRCWGLNRSGEVGDGSLTPAYTPVPAGWGLHARAVAAGFAHTCIIAWDDDTYCWGDEALLGTTGASSGGTPPAVDGNHRFIAIASSYHHTCGLELDGGLYCWGWNDHGQLGDGTVGTVAGTPVRVESPVGFAAVATGNGFTCALSRGGDPYCWGVNGEGQLGVAISADVLAPVRVPSTEPFISLTAGSDHACGLTLRGRAFCWGANGSGQLGTGDGLARFEPTLAAKHLRFTALAAGTSHTCGLVAGGRIYCWGSNDSGQLGDGSETSAGLPVLVRSDSTTFESLTAGDRSTCGRTSQATTLCWGLHVAAPAGDEAPPLQAVTVPTD